MEIIRDQVFSDETVRLDGKHFIDCRFTSCTLEYGGEEVIFERTAMHDCNHMLYGHARQTAKYMQLMGLLDETRDRWTDYTGKVT